MDWNWGGAAGGCPIWVDPDNMFRLVVKVSKWVAEDSYGRVEMSDQEHELWLDRSQHYSLDKFHEEMATKIYWGPMQTLAVWVVEKNSASSWKIRRDEHFQRLILDRWHEREAVLSVDVVSKYDSPANDSSDVRCASGVTSMRTSSDAAGNVEGSTAPDNVEGSAVPEYSQGDAPGNAEGSGDTWSNPPPFVPAEQAEPVDWAELTILQEPNEDGEAKAVADEDKIYEAMGFKAIDERAEEAARESIPIPGMSAEMQDDMAEAAVPVDDHADNEPNIDWDRDNPDLSVGVSYPCMEDFRLAVRQHAIVKEFELATTHSDHDRFRGQCASLGCPWIIRARTQHDGTVRVQINSDVHRCASRTRVVVGRMASQGWVAERAIPFLKRKPSMGPKALKEELENKYNIDIPYKYKGFKLLPPIITEKKGPGRTKKNRFLGPFERTGKRTRQVQCQGCKQFGHRSSSWRCPLTGTKKRKRTKKTSAPRPGRPKKAKTDEGTSVQSSPRTRAAAAKEAAARAAKDAQLAADRAAAAAEAAAIAEAAVIAEEGAVATQARSAAAKRGRAAAAQQVRAAAEEAAGSPQTPPRNNNLELQIVNQMEVAHAAPTKITPRKKLATKIKKVPTKVKSPGKKKSPAKKGNK